MAQTSPTTDRSRLWQWFLPGLCVLSMIGVAWTNALLFGTGARPEFGYWDAVTIPSEQPFVAEIVHTTPGGAAERAGIRDGDRIDVRDLGIYDRIAMLFQPVTSVPVTLVVLRGGEKRAIAVTGRTVYDGNVPLKVAVAGIHAVAEWWILGCALLLALRRWQTREGRYLCLGLVAFAGAMWLTPTVMVSANGMLLALCYLLAGCALITAALLPVALARSFGVR
jgi:hypothetical protein